MAFLLRKTRDAFALITTGKHEFHHKNNDYIQGTVAGA